MTRLAKTLRVSRSGFYAWRSRPESPRLRDDRRLSVLVRAVYEESRNTYGSPRVHVELAAQGERVSRKRVARLMRQEGLKARVRRRYRCTTMSEHDQPVAPNLLRQDFQADAPNRRWVGDTTELAAGSGRLYLAAIVDLYARFVVGWAVSAVNDRILAGRALEQALRRRAPDGGVLHHSDQGSPYASEDYRKALDGGGFICSMSRRGNCYDNAAMESWFSTLKMELGDRFESHAHAKRALFDYIEVFYNQKRRHSTVGYLSPGEYERRYAGSLRPPSAT